MEKRIDGKAIVPGAGEGIAVVSTQPLSFWGGISPDTGEVIDRRHERYGTLIAGKVFVFPHGKGSSTASAVLIEAIKKGKAPSAIITSELDPILTLGAIIADELYHKTIPVVVISEEDFGEIREGDHLSIHPNGQIGVGGAAQKGDLP